MNENDRGFAYGVAWAAALLKRTYGEDLLAESLLNESGFTLTDLKQAKVDEYDLSEIRKLDPEWMKRRVVRKD